MHKKHKNSKKLLAVLLSLNLTFGMGTFSAFAAELESASADTGCTESSEAPAAPNDSGGDSTDIPAAEPDSSPAEGSTPADPVPPDSIEPDTSNDTTEPPESDAPAESETDSSPGEQQPAELLPAEQESPAETPVETAVRDFVVDDIKYTVSDDGVTVMDYTGDATELVIPATVTYAEQTYDVTSVLYGLQYNTHLTSVDIQAPITKVNNSLFLGCTGLTSVKLPDTVTTIETAAFQNCSSLTEIELPEGLETIMNGAFKGTALTYLTLPSSLTEIQSGAFQSLATLTSVDFGDAAVRVGDKAFQYCSSLTTITNTENITALGDYAFGSDYQNLNNAAMYVPLEGEIALNSVTKLGKAAFKNCIYLTSVAGLHNVSTIPAEAFDYCSRLTRVSGLENVTSLGDKAFADCASLLRIDGKYVKTGIEELEGLKLSNLTDIGANALSSLKASFELTEDTFSNLHSLGEGAFANSNAVSGKLVLPEGITTVGKDTFRATAISEVILPNSVRSIGVTAFFNCKSLTAVQIGLAGGQSSQLTQIDSAAFANNTAIESFVIESASSDVAISTDTVTIGFQQFTTFAPGVEEKITYTVRAVESYNIYADDETTDLQTAVDRAADGDTITATKDFLVKSTVTIPAGKTITLTGENLIVQPDKGLSGPLFFVESGAKLILDGTLTYKANTLTSGSLALVNGEMTFANGSVLRAAVAGSNTGVIDADGGSFTMEGGSISKVSADSANSGVVYVHNNGSFTMEGGEITACTFTNQETGAAVVNGGTITMTGGTISGNTNTNAFASAGVCVGENSLFTMEDGAISGNTGKRGAGVYVGAFGKAYDETTAAQFVMNGGTISNNIATPATSTVNAGGGGVFVEDNGAFTLNGGCITGNKVTSDGMGGGVATSNKDRNGGGRFTMNGGTISENTAGNSGGGIYSYSDVNAVVLNGGYITNNKAGANGGGVYVSHDPYGLTINNALITGNTAAVQGGGVWSCPLGNIYLGTDSAVFDNTADQSGDDLGFAVKWNADYTTTFFGKMLGGGLVTWYSDTSMSSIGGDQSHGAFGGARYDAANPGAPAVPPVNGITPNGYALKAVVSADGKLLAKNAARLFIEGNTAAYGGGIGSNGKIVMNGSDTPDTTSITVHKIWKDSDSTPATVTVNLIRTAADGTKNAIGTVLLSEKSTDQDGNTWSYTFTGLDKDGTYSVEETALDGYKTEITGGAEQGFTITNTKQTDTPGGGGGGGHHHDPKPDPTPDQPPVDIPDEDPPSPPTEEPTENIPDQDVPPVENPTADIPDENIPTAGVPMSDVPKTGDIGALWAMLFGLSALGLAALGLPKKHDER